MNQDPYLLRNQLLGKEGYRAPGLLQRVAERVLALTRPITPGLRTGSIIGMVDHSRGGDDDSDADRCFALLVGLVEWSGRGIGTSSGKVQRDLAEQIQNGNQSDLDLLLGTVRRAKVHRGHIERTHDRVQRLLRPEIPTESALDRCSELDAFLRDWLGQGCTHIFKAMPSDDPRIVVMECRCGASYVEDGPGWAAV